MKTISLIDKKSSENPSFNNAIFNKFVEKLKYFNYDYDLIEVEYKSDRYGPLPAPGSFFDFKMKQFYKILENYDENEVILYLDSFDVLPLAGPDEVYQKYKSFNADIVFSYEKNCWPNLGNMNRFYPKKDYINAGIYMGINSQIRKIMDYSFTFDTIQFYDDQHAWALLTRLIRDGIKVEVDTKSNIALSLNDMDISGYGIVEDRLVNFIDNTKPCFIHGNNRSFNGYIEDKNKNTINTLLDIYEL
jgi:hypothetical protein